MNNPATPTTQTAAESIRNFQQMINRIEDTTERLQAVLDSLLSLYK